MEKKRKLVEGIVLISIFLFFIAYPKVSTSITSADICSKHNVSTGEFTPCFYCHNAEAPEEPGFTINSDSQFCLSCHDGSAIDTSAYVSAGSAIQRITAARPPIGHVKGVDHPFSVDYNSARNFDPNLRLKRPVSIRPPVKLFNGKVECASCHDPHSCKNPLFLRISNDRSKLCLACHDM